MALNVELLNKVKDAILARPHDFDMSDWKANIGNSSVVEKEKSCGTACCIAGWAAAIELGKDISALKERGICDIAAEALCGDYEPYFVEDNLFYTVDWPLDLRDKYNAAKTDKERAQVAAERIDRFIAENA